MLIDWFTVIAQAANFLILIWLMKRFLYQPILKALDAREQRIAAELADADEKKTEALKERDEFQHKNEEFDQQRAALLSQATDEAKAERQRLFEEARKDAESLRAKLQETRDNEQRSLNRELTIRTRQEVFAIARKTLADLAGAPLEERMVEVFIHRIRELSGEEKAQMATVQPALVRSTFDLPPAQKTAVASAVKESIAADIQIRFETASDQVSGIELVSNGHKLAWSIAEYLAAMEKSVGEVLQQKPQSALQPVQNAK
jgi:F-type H+-transporting ATPase subunit b